MKDLWYSLAMICLSVAGFTGCAADSASDNDTTDIEAPPQTTVVRYGTEDIKALPPGEFLQLDLDTPNTVYSVRYTSSADLDRVLLLRGDYQDVLSRHPAATMGDSRGTEKQIIISGDGDKPHAAASPDCNGAESDGRISSCRCPCCMVINDQLICCT